MNRTFLSLYLLIVASVLGFGWLADQIWRTYASGPELSHDRAQLIKAIANSVSDIEVGQVETQLLMIAEGLDLDLSLYSWTDFAESSTKEKLLAGQIVSIHDEADQTLYYYLLPSKHAVLVLSVVNVRKSDQWLYRFLMIAFYFLVAVAIYFWVLPLTRDLKKLQNNADKVGRDGKMETLALKPSSAIYGLAQTFNKMSTRIRGLLAAQKEMTHGISHELRTPLARMKFTLASLEASYTHGAEIESLRENIIEMEQLISQFLNYASFEARNDEIEFKLGDLEPMIDRLVSSLDEGIRVDVENELKSGSVYCEWNLIEHCVKNLVQNASRYCYSYILIQLGETDHQYVIRVNDDGPGVPEPDQHHIFDAFFRSKSKNEDRAGFGLGLALVKRIMAWHRGQVSYEDSAIGGACFVLAWEKTEEDIQLV